MHYRTAIFTVIVMGSFSFMPAYAEDELVVKNFRDSVKRQTQHDYSSHPFPVGVGDDNYIITYSEHNPQKHATRWGRPENYDYTYNAVKPEKDTVTPQRTWFE